MAEGRLLMPSRGCVAPNYFLMTPDNFVSNALPHFAKTVTRLLTTPRDAAAGLASICSRSNRVEAACGRRAKALRTSCSNSTVRSV